MKILQGALLCLILSAPFVAGQTAALLQNRGQEKSQWCWNACSEMVLDWKGVDSNQNSIAAWAIGGVNAGNFLDTGNGGMGPYRDPVTKRIYFRKGIKQVLRAFGRVPSQRLSGALAWEEVKAELDAERPFIYALTWRNPSGRTLGGHVGVAKDYNETPVKVVTIEDPWPVSNLPAAGTPGISEVVPYSILVGEKTTTYQQFLLGGSGAVLNDWDETLVLGKSLDLVFLIDTTGSMGPYIANVQQQAQRLLNNLDRDFDDVRVAVVEYRDVTAPDRFNYRVVTRFTGSLPAAKSAINSLRLGDGGDPAEALFTSVHDVALGEVVGTWRPGNEVARHVILMGDAFGHDPEPWANPKTIRQAIAALRANGVSLQAVHVGTNAAAKFDFTALAAGSGGKVVSSGASSEVATLIEGVFADIETGRFPVASTVLAAPTFTYSPPGGGIGGASLLSSLTVELDSFDTRRGAWRSYRKFKVADLSAQSLEITKALPPGSYRWRLSGASRSGESILPDGSGTQLADKGRFVEEEYIAFDRVANVPRAIRKVTPSVQTPADRTHALEFHDDSLADAFAVRLTDTATEKQKTLVIKRVGTLSGAQPQTLRVYVRSKPGQTFIWQIQGLNNDRKKVDPDAWN